MISAKSGLILRICALACLAGLLVFLFGFAGRGYVRAAPAPQETSAYPYDFPTDIFTPESTDQGYGAPATDTPGNETPAAPVTATAAGTPTQTSTLPPDLFRTEDAQMNNAQTTQQVTETPGATFTPYDTPTVLKTQPQRTLTPVVKKKEGFTPDWGMFWIGFSLPVLGACGVVLYLLDRRPDLFKRKK